MNKEQIKEAILGQPDCKKEDTPLCQFATFHPDMEMVEILLKGADIQKSLNNQPLGWVFQFCEPNWDKMLELLFKYKYYALHLNKTRDFEYLLRLLDRVKKETVLYVLKIMRNHNFELKPEQGTLLQRNEFRKVFELYDEKRLHTVKIIVQACFALMERECVEDVNKQDCRTLCARIYRVPKRWTEKISKRKTLLDILTDNPNDALSRKSVKKYLTTFKEYMRYAVQEDIIENSLNDFVDLPSKLDGQIRTPFEATELRKMFNPETYPNPHGRKDMPKFWIPIIALYHGCRLNEICQLDVNDIVQEKGIPCININDNGEDKSPKNKGSNRIIPIHPKLLNMGFLIYVEYQRREHKKKLFDLVRIKNGMYGRPVQAWFARYLDKIGITGKDKVFHSFRHTFETMATEKKIPPQYQNAICGWAEQGIGQRVYAYKKDIKIMLEELSRIDYPINRELNALGKEFMDSYAVRWKE